MSSSEVPAPKLTSFQKQIKREFISTYLHSQGHSDLQRNIFNFMERYHRSQLGHTVLRLLPESSDWLAFQKAPSAHPTKGSGLVITTVNRDSASEAVTFYLELEKPRTNYTQPLPSVLLEQIMARDLRYQEKARHIGSDPHASYFRKHVILGETTGLAVFDAMYSEVGAAEKSQTQAEVYEELAAAWEKNHPDETFATA